ncbi:hypothetical protein [Brumimicrobium oceani]|uniref:MalT-like TPR region domain-containing protein n=1 Tax=Brumimicrobium oceani TaxID=2100725 RepID=A0A2U2XCH5_9FLAO|nr:hypothetical protein [Brumimicrobium oceani]PWH85450.1 hypothetical protein DIT68_09335 [Brumimicrobium oceani]
MSKTASPALFELIKSLTKSEKRYFKIYASRHTIGEENNGVRIFDFIDQQEKFDEEEIYENFKGEAFLNQFPITKNRLYEQIISALDAFYASKDLEAQLYKMLHSINILYSKGLYDHAVNELKKAKRLANKHNKVAILLQLANKEKMILETRGYQKANTKSIDKHKQETLDLANQYSLYNSLWSLKSKLFIQLNQYGQARSSAELERYNELYEGFKQIEQPKEISFENQYLINHFKSAYYFAILENEKSLELLKENLAHFKANQNKMSEHPNQYFSILTNIIHSESKLGNSKAIHIHLNELKAFPHQLKSNITEDLAIKLFSSINSIELKILNQEGNFNKAIALSEEIKNGLEKYEEEITPFRKAYLAFNMSIAHFGNEDFNQSLKWINVILNNKDLDQKEDIVSFAHLLNLLIHFELKNDDLLPYAIKSTKRFLSKRKRTFKFESLFLKNLTKISNAQNKYEIEDLLQNIDEEIKDLKNDPFESVAFEYFDFHLWLISKVKNKSFQEVKREDYLIKRA